MTLEFVSNVLGVASVAVSTAIYMNMKVQERKNNKVVGVKLILVDGSYEVSLPLRMLRKDVSRAEMLGRMGMIPMKEKGKRFSIRSLFTQEFMDNIMEVQLGKSDTVIIPCTREEIEQFDIPNS
jgi:hypothetical protein